MTELLSELRRSPVVGDRAVAELLDSLRPAEGSRPRASEALAAFIAERGSGVTPPGRAAGDGREHPACWWFSAAPRTPSRLAAGS